MFSIALFWARIMEYHSVILLLVFVEINNGSKLSTVYSTVPCLIHTGTINIPCSQHLFVNQPHYCASDKLQQLFPHLYSKPTSSVKYPGPVRLLEPNHSNITWNARQDGSVYFLKGFQVVQTGTDMSNFGRKQCAVIDISNVSETEFTYLPNITFTVDFKRPGAYKAEVRSLPLGPSGDVDIVDITQDPMYEEYHPKIDVTFDYKQLNQSCVNVSLVLLPEVKDVDQIRIDTFYNGEYFQNLSAPIPYTVLQYIPICDLMPGNYTMQISLIDKILFTDGPKQCLCYKGTVDVSTCQPCKKYSRTFYVDKDIKPISNAKDDDHVVTITLAILCPIMVIAITAVVLFVLYRRHGNRIIFCRKKNSSWKQGEINRRTVCVLFCNDHEAHTKAAQAFIQMLEATTGCSVKTLNFQNKRASSDSMPLDGSKSCHVTKDCDVIIVIHSEYMHYLVSESSECMQQPDKRHTEDINIIQALSQVKISSNLCQKTVSVYFDYTDKSFVNLLGSESLFFLPLQYGHFRSHLVNKVGTFEQQEEGSQGFEMVKEKEQQFFSSVNRACLYQKCCTNWFSVKLFSVQTSYSSDDSGIIVTNRKTKRQRSIRSKSADTVCKCEMYQPISDCSNCNRTLPRRHSVDYSFFPPETTISDDVSVRLSLLESRLVAFNDRYDFIMNNNSKDTEYDCLTIDGYSV